MLTLLCAVGEAGASPPIAPEVAPSAIGSGPGIGPVAGWIDDVIRELGGNSGNQSAAWAVVNAAGGALDEFDRQAVAQYLDASEAVIDTILDPTTYPSLAPYDVGEVDASVQPTTLAECADACATLALDAHMASLHNTFDEELIGTKLKTIRALLPAYRTLAGIDD